MASIAPELLSEERLHLIQRLSHAIGRKYVDSATHALLWLGDLESLRRRVEHLESDIMFKSLVKLSLMNTRLCMDALKAWLARSSRKNEPTETIEQPVEPTESTSALAASPTTSRKRKSTGELRSRSKRPRLEWSLAVRDMAEERYIGCCAIIKMGEPVQVCHIYPFALGIEAEWEKEKFWNILQIFWDLETVDRWKKDIIGPNGTEVPQNLLCLSTVVHDLWGSARLAFEPVKMSEEKTSLTMRFWWLPRRAYSKEMDISTYLLRPTRDDDDPGSGGYATPIL
ncbi:hypothetical protein AFLA_012429 [Aspergillus flavus NRRL3357]|nr:hypothetical protein AFLA_012429 [Aspergillus flavus NRRL3357]